MRPSLVDIFQSIDQLFKGCEMDFAILHQQEKTAAWFEDYANQRVVNSFLFNYIKIQDKLGAKLFRHLLIELREIDDPSTTMIDILNRLEKLRIIDDVKDWDRLREIRNSITHEYPQDIAERIDNIELALNGFVLMRNLYQKVKHFAEQKLAL